jgi:hypothetical protein
MVGLPAVRHSSMSCCVAPVGGVDKGGDTPLPTRSVTAVSGGEPSLRPTLKINPCLLASGLPLQALPNLQQSSVCPMPSDSLTATAGAGLLALLAQGNSEVGQRAARPIPERRPASPFASDKHLLGSRLPARANS